MPNHSTESTESTELASGQITPSDHVTVQLARPADMPAAERTRHPAVVVQILWPPQPTWITPQRFPDVAAQLAQLFARAHTALASLKAGKQL